MTYDPFWGTSGPIDANQFFVSSPYSDAGFGPSGGGYFSSMDIPDSYWMPSAPSESWWDNLSSGVGDALGSLDLGDVAKLGLAGLGAWGSYQDYKTKRDLAKAQVTGDQSNRELGAGDDFAKMHALAQIIQARQGINLDPSLAYAQAVRKKMGLSPDGATEFAGVDIGGPMQTGISSADRLDAINQATGVNFAGGGGVTGGLANFLRQHQGAMGLLKPAPQRPQVEGMPNFISRRFPEAMQRLHASANAPQPQIANPRLAGALGRIIGRQGMLPGQQMNMASGGDVEGLLAGGSPGQEDRVNASLSHGEYVFDADTVAALGDGNTEAGAAELDRMREAIRRHKRSAPASKIPPPSKGALAYLKGVK